MGSVLSWIANGVLFVLGCFLAADVANDVIAATVLAPPPAETVAEPREAAPAQRRWNDRQVIVTRNLFKSSTLAPAAPLQEEEDLEKSRLPVTLLGTFAATDPSQSRATLKDREKNETLVVGVGDEIRSQALVMRIERRRVVLSENGVSRELTLDEEGAKPTQSVRRAAARPLPRPTPAPAGGRNLGDNRFAITREEVDEAVRNPAELLRQARVQPKFEDGEMVGLQVSGIKAGSVFEELGVQEGDVIMELNGIAIESPGERMQILQELSDAQEFNVVVRSADGNEKTLTGSVSE